MNRVFVNNDHEEAFYGVLGVEGAPWFLRKAERELRRYNETTDREDRIDALINFASTIISLEDWTFRGVGDVAAQAWRSMHRDQSPEHEVIALIALISKHRLLRDGRFSRMQLQPGEGIKVWTESVTPGELVAEIGRQLPGVGIYVRTLVDDDEIVGYEVLISVQALRVGNYQVAVPEILRRALAYWAQVVE